MQGPRKRPFASWSGFRREHTPACAKSLVSLPPVSHFLAAFTRQHFKHALNASHAGGDEGAVVVVEIAAATREIGTFGPAGR